MNWQRSFRLAVRFAWREMRGGLRGFAIFLACIALGVAAVGGVNAVAQAINSGLSNEGQALLGGDVRFELNQRTANAQEAEFLASYGQVSTTAAMRSMARLPDGSDQSLVEVKAVDGLYPLYGALKTEPGLPLDGLLSQQDGTWGAVAPQLLFDRLGLEPGDRLLLGQAEFELRAQLLVEPDAVSDGFGFAPRLMISGKALEASGLQQPGALIEYRYKIAMNDASEGGLQSLIETARTRFPQAGWSVRSRDNASPALAANIERFSQFLTLVGLTALVVGGVGIGNAVRAYLDSKVHVIATFKCLGAPNHLVFMIYLIQVLMIAVLGIVAGLVLAALTPVITASVLAGLLPISGQIGLYPGALALAALFGFLVTLVFALLPLGRTQDVPATALFRSFAGTAQTLPRWPYLAAIGVSAFGLAGLAVLNADAKQIAITFVAATFVTFLVLRLVSLFIQALARRLPRVHSTALRLAIGNVHRPGALTPSVVLSLGLGLTLLVTIALIDGDLRRQITGNLPEQAPSFFFVDIKSSQADQFAEKLKAVSPNGKIIRVPMLRGRVVALNGVDVDKVSIAPGGEWVLRGDRGLTYAKNVPENSTLVDGEWWAADYQGEPLVSFAAEEASELGLKVGDTVSVNVLGRNITARIANLRRVEWESMAINFVMVFSPNTFAGAPHAWIATLTDENASAEGDAKVLNEVTRAFPTVTSIGVKDALEVVNRLVGQIGLAIRAAAAVALIASVLVLSGALAAGNRARIHDAVVLKTLGATRLTLIRAYCYEYMLLGAATAVFALFAGSIGSWFVISKVMGLTSSVQPFVAVSILVIALMLTVGFGLIGTWRVLGHKAAPVLRNL